MAELSTIARPYAQGLWKALQDHKASSKAAGALAETLDTLSEVCSDPRISQLVSDPKLTDAKVFDLLAGVLGKEVPSELTGLLRVVIENGRLAALPEIAAQFHALKNESEGVADAYIETAFAMSQDEVNSLIKSLAKKFPGVKLNPVVQVNPDLIGGVSIRVGDRILDGSVRARLAQMQTALTA